MGQPMASEEAIRLLPSFEEPNGSLIVFQGLTEAIPFVPKRVFVVKADKGSIRGNHAHKVCWQFLSCLSGSIAIELVSDTVTTKITLTASNQGVIIPPLTWSSQEYIEDGTVLMALCSEDYEEEDYIRDFREFQGIVGQDQS